jgi:hypothetical protein
MLKKSSALKCVYNSDTIDIVSRFSYIVLIFTHRHEHAVQSSHRRHLAMRGFLQKYVGLTPKHRCSLCDWLIDQSGRRGTRELLYEYATCQ